MSFNHISPARGYYALEAVEQEQKSAFKTVTNDPDMPQVGRVVAVGEPVLHPSGSEFIEADYEVGDVLAFPRYTDNKLKLDGAEFILVKFADVMGKLIEESK